MKIKYLLDQKQQMSSKMFNESFITLRVIWSSLSPGVDLLVYFRSVSCCITWVAWAEDYKTVVGYFSSKFIVPSIMAWSRSWSSSGKLFSDHHINTTMFDCIDDVLSFWKAVLILTKKQDTHLPEGLAFILSVLRKFSQKCWCLSECFKFWFWSTSYRQTGFFLSDFLVAKWS